MAIIQFMQTIDNENKVVTWRKYMHTFLEPCHLEKNKVIVRDIIKKGDQQIMSNGIGFKYQNRQLEDVHCTFYNGSYSDSNRSQLFWIIRVIDIFFGKSYFAVAHQMNYIQPKNCFKQESISFFQLPNEAS